MTPAVFYVDVEETDGYLYNYRRPHAEAARARGLAFVGGHRTARTKGLATLGADTDALFAFETLVVDDVVEAVRRAQTQYDVRAIMCHAGQPSPLGPVGCIVGQAAERLGLRHATPRSIEFCNEKLLCRQALAAAGVRTVDAAIGNSAEELVAAAERIGWPVIFKPPLGGSCAFVAKIADARALASHYAHATERYHGLEARFFTGCEHVFTGVDGVPHHYLPGRTFQVERYVPGPEGSVECAVVGGRVVPLIVHDKLLVTEKEATIYEDLLITPPVTFTAEQVEEIEAYACAAIEATGLTDALVHLEFRYERGVGPQVVEINPRLGGLYVDEAFRDLLGIDPFGLYLDILLGRADVDALLEAKARPVPRTPYRTMFVVYPPRSGVFRGVDGYEDAARMPGILRSKIGFERGTFLAADDVEHFLVKFWGEGESADDVTRLYDTVKQAIRIEME